MPKSSTINASGFALMEVMVVMALSAIFAGSFFGAFGIANTELRRNGVYFDTNKSAKRVVELLSRDVGESVDVIASRGGVATDTNSLILKLPSIDAAGAPTSITTHFDYVTYKTNPANSKQLFRSVDILNGTSQREGGVDVNNAIVASNLQNIIFSFNGTPLSSVSQATIPTMKKINVQVTAQGTTRGVIQQTQVDSDLMLKNHIT